MARSVALADASTSNGNKTAKDWDGGVATLHASGTWDGASLTLEFKPNAPTGETVDFSATDVVLSSGVPVKNFFLPEGQVRVVQATSGGTTSLTCIATRAQLK